MDTVKEYVVTITNKGQITIPAEVREQLGLAPQDKVVFRLVEGNKVELELLPMTLQDAYGSVTPLNQPEDFAALLQIAREERGGTVAAPEEKVAMQFVDTNIFIRYLTQDDPIKAAACLCLFEQARRDEIELTTSEAVIAEVVFVLSSKRLYKLSRQEIRARLYLLLSLPGFKLSSKQQFLRSLDLYSNHSIDFEDALSIALMEHQGINEIYSYDEDFDRVRGSAFTRLEP